MGVDSFRFAGLESVRLRRRRWPYALGMVSVVALACVGAAGGAAISTQQATVTAAQLSSRGDYAAAIALDDQIATRDGALYLLSGAQVSAARDNAQSTVLDWAASLARQGKVDTSIALLATVTNPKLIPRAEAERTSLLLVAAKADAARGAFSLALQRLDQLEGTVRASGIPAGIDDLIGQYELGQARSLLASGDGVDAVSLLDSLRAAHQNEAAAANAALPAALLAAGQEELSDLSYVEAASTLQRLVNDYPGSAEAQSAQHLLGAAQPVAGTLADRYGRAITGRVRLSSHYYTIAGGYYTTGPFYYSSTNSAGDFVFQSIPVGGPYYFEVYENGDWTTFIDRSTGQPANPVTVTPLTPVNLTFIAVP